MEEQAAYGTTESAVQTETPSNTAEDSQETASTQEPEQTGADADKGAESEPEKKTADADKLAKDNARMANALKNLQKQLADVKSQTVEQPKAGAQDAHSHNVNVEDDGVHPALRGLDIDPDTDEVEYKGVLVTKDFVIDQYEKQQVIDQLQAKLNEAEVAKQAQAELEIQQEAAQAVVDALTGIRAETFPQLPKEAGDALDTLTVGHVEQVLAKSLVEGKELTSELVTSVATEYMNTLKVVLGAMGQKQLEDNANYRTNFPAKPDGVAGTPVPQKPVSREAQQKLIAERTRLAEEMSG